MAVEKNYFPVNGTSALKPERKHARTMGQAHIIEFDAVRRSRITTIERVQPTQKTFMGTLRHYLNLDMVKAVLIDAMQPQIKASAEDRRAFGAAAAITFFLGLVAIGFFG